MENSPQTVEDDEDDKDLKPRSWLYEVTQKKEDEDKPSWFSRFIENKPDKEDKPEESIEEHRPKLKLIKNEVEPPEIIEAEQSTKPDLELVPDESSEELPEETEASEKKEWPEVVEAVKLDTRESTPDPITDPVVENFFEKVEIGEEPKKAFEEVMTDLGVEESKIKELESETTVEAEPVKQIELEPAKQITYESIPVEEPEEFQDGAVVQPHTPPTQQPPSPPKQAENIVEKSTMQMETEQDPKPKIEQRIESMKTEIVEKVKKIREVTADKVSNDGPKVIENFKKEKEDLIPVESFTEIPEPQTKPEHIGHMIIDAESKKVIETTPETKADSSIDSVVKVEGDPLAERKLETLNRTELLAISDKIMIDGTSLRHIFETHLIGERGLRRIIREHLRGGDLKKALQMEIVEREIDFERDPVVRDIPPPAYNPEQNSTPAPEANNLNNLVQKASAQINSNNEGEAFIRAKAAYEVDQVDQMQKTRHMIDITFVVVISALTLVVIYLLLRG